MQSRKKIWDKLFYKAHNVTDGLGKKIDEGVKNTVISLWAFGFATTASCEGHINWGVKAPWIDLGEMPDDKDLQKIRAKSITVNEIFHKYPNLKALRKKNLKTQSKLLELLTQFYTNHKVAEDERLILAEIGIYGMFRLTNQGLEVQEINTKYNQKIKLKDYQKEIQDFGYFLKNKYIVG